MLLGYERSTVVVEHMGCHTDYCIAEQTLLFTFTIVAVFVGRDGLGRHVTNLSPGTIREFALLATIASTINIMATALARIGFAVSLLRVAEGWPRRFTWAVIFTSNVVSGLSGLFLWVQCTPIRKNWDNLNFGYCWAPRVRVAIPIMNTGEWPQISYLMYT